MKSIAQNYFYITNNFGVFVGVLPKNSFHKHYALQISLTDKGSLTVVDEKGIEHQAGCFFINTKILHQLTCNEPQLTILINPLSALGYYFLKKHERVEITQLRDEFSGSLKKIFIAANHTASSFTSFVQNLSILFIDLQCNVEKENSLHSDSIAKAIDYLDQHIDRIVSLDEMARICCLSKSRLLHLFKEKTGFHFRRYQLWNRLVKSISFLQGNSIAETAYTFGFSDGSHYTRTFKETFGLTPKFLASKQ